MWLVAALAFAILFVTALAVAAALRLRPLFAFGLAFYVCACAEIVLLTEALSQFRLVSRRGYLAGELILLVAALALWHVRGRPRPARPHVRLAATRRHLLLVGLGAVVFAGVLYAAFLGVATPPNNGDSMAYRLFRVVAWLQYGGVHWIPDAHTARANELPSNAEIEILYTFALLDRETLATLPQLAALGAVMLAVAGCARRLGFSRPAAAFAALLTATLTQIALQSTTTQNDLVVASFVAAAAYFLRRDDPRELALAAAAIGLALGTKPTAFLALPTLALLAAVSLRAKRALLGALVVVIGFAALGAQGYVRNLAHTGSPLGDAMEQAVYRPEVTLTGTTSTVARAAYRFVDFSGFRIRSSWLEPSERLGETVFKIVGIQPNPPESAGQPFTFTINLSVHEDHSFFGPLGALLVLPLGIGFTLASMLGRTTAARTVHAVSLPLYLLLLALVLRFSDEGRYLITPVVLTMPLAAALYRRRVLAGTAAALGVATLFFAHAYNMLKPTGLGGGPAIWSLPRPVAQGLDAPGIGQMVAGLDTRVPSDARLGVRLSPNARGYPLYGPKLDRELVPLPDVGMLEVADAAHLEWVFLGIEQHVPPLGECWRRIDLARTATLLERLNVPACGAAGRPPP